MPLTPNTKLGAYEILSALGAGGMGEVYRARDNKLGREVAIKVLPEEFTQHPQKLARFEREARLLAALNHPGIATLYGVEEAKGKPFLVMELVEGETLAERISRGPLPVGEALTLSQQIAEALEAAHEKGVIHRDLKPANIKVDPEGRVKVLDFGLAKAFAEEVPESELSQSPTLSRDATRAGVILGTAAYMSPEQAKGKTVDKRSDIFSFGIVLYEMLTGKKAFAGEDVSDVLAAIIKSEPDWSVLPKDLDSRLDALLRRCLRKDRKLRRHDIGDVRVEIDEIIAALAAAPKPGSERRLIGTAVAAAVLLSGMVAVAVWSLKPEPARPLVRVVATTPSFPPSVNSLDVDVAVTPDGTHIVYPAILDGQRQLVVRALDQLEAIPLAGLGTPRGPFISPDGNWVAYFDGTSALRKVSILGGPPVTVCEVLGGSRGGSWRPDDTIIFATAGGSGLWRVPAGGGKPEELTTPDPEQGNHLWPEILPGGEAVLFAITSGSVENAQIAVLSLVTGEIEVLVPGGSNPRYAPTGHIVYGVGGTLRAVGFDVERLEVTSDPFPVLDDVITKASGAAAFGISGDGSLVYITGDPQTGQTRTLVWVDREGKEEALAAEPRAYRYPRISPDGSQVALDMRDQELDIWIWDFTRETLRRLTFNPSNDLYPAWTPDSRRLAFSSARDGNQNLFSKAADGTGTVERLTESENLQHAYFFSPDGKQLVYRELHPREGDLVVLSLDGDGSSVPLLATEFDELNAEISPDGRWLAYQSNASGQYEIFVRPFPNVDEGQLQISTASGTEPLWARDGSELFYLDPGGQLTAVSVRTDPSLDFGNAEVVLEESYLSAAPGATGRTYDVSPNGERFLRIKEGGAGEQTSPAELILVLNWFDELKRLVPTN